MNTTQNFSTSSFELVAKGLIALHRLIKDGTDDSPEGESIRDSLDEPLDALDSVEKVRSQWLSEDLYSISEPSVASGPKQLNEEAQQHLSEAMEAKQRGEWDRALALLRRWRDDISPALLSYLRGSIWREAENAFVAAEFFHHACQLDAKNEKYLAAYMQASSEAEPMSRGETVRDLPGPSLSLQPLGV